MILAGLTGVWLWWRGRLFRPGWYLWPATRAANAWWDVGFVSAVICGGSSPRPAGSLWVAYGVLRTADAVSPLAAHTVATTLVLFVLVYGVVFAMGIYYINRLIARGPQGPRSRLTAGRRQPSSATGRRTQRLVVRG